MRNLHVILIDNCIMKSRINANMSEQTLHLLNRHSFVNSHSCQRTTKFVRMYFGYIQSSTHFPNTHLYTADCQSIMRSRQRNE